MREQILKSKWHQGILCLVLLVGAVLAQAQNAPVASKVNQVPQINQPLVPEAALPGSSGLTLTVNGTGFVPKSAVHWNGQKLTTTYVSSTQLKAAVSSMHLATAKTASVTVFSVGPGGGTSNVDFLQITNPSSAVTFTSSTEAPTEWTQRMAAVDLNGDGELDLVGALPFQDVVSVRMGVGNGTFGPEVDYATGACEPGDLVIRDFNGDGKLDVAISCTGLVSVLLGNGDGTFRSPIYSAIDPGLLTFQIAAGDFNRDGKLDLVVGYQDPSSNAVTVLLGNGDGTFHPPVDYPTGNEPGAVAVADLNGDGKVDIVAANFGVFGGNTVSVLIGNGDGTFQPQQQYTTSNGALSVIAADFNGDGKLDLAVDGACGNPPYYCGYPGDISILLGNGDGTFQPRTDYDVYGFPYTVSSGDYNGDGILDLLVPSLDYSQVSVFLGNGDGTFGSPQVVGFTGPYPVGVAPGDFNGNGKLDAVIGTAGGFTLLLQ